MKLSIINTVSIRHLQTIMKMKRTLLAFTLCGILATSCQAKENNAENPAPETTETSAKKAKVVPEYLTQQAFKTKVADYEGQDFKYLGDKPCVIDIYAVWCGPCKKLAPVLEELAGEYQGKVQFYKVDAEKETELAAAIGIRSYPTLLFIAKDKKPILVEGAYPKEALQEIIRENLLDPTEL